MPATAARARSTARNTTKPNRKTRTKFAPPTAPLVLPRDRTGTLDRGGLRSLTIPEFAAAVRCSENHVRNKVADGTIRAFRVGRAVRILASELERILTTPANLDPLAS